MGIGRLLNRRHNVLAFNGGGFTVQTEITELIKRRRNQIVINSLIYYEFNDNIIADYVYDAWSKELAELQRQYTSESAAAPLAEMFADFDGSTGYQLVGRATEQQRARAESLLRYYLLNGRTI